jgi:polyisoprenyl-teichoic acid--peptidoglycan teichoic acid transferase
MFRPAEDALRGRFASGATVVTISAVADGGRIWTPDRPLFVLLVGDDSRPPGEGCGCSDSIHVVGVPAGGGSAVILGIPRDTRVDVPGKGPDRINAAWQQGGNPLAAEVVGKLVGVHIDYVVHVNFAAFPKLIDDIGGVDIDLPVGMADENSGAFINRGRQHLDGETALAYSRNRHIPGGDFARSENQARLILAVLAKLRAKGTGAIDTVRNLAVLLRHADTTGMSASDLHRLGRLAMSIDPASVRNVPMPGTTGTIDGASYVLTDDATPGLFADFADDAVLESH